MSKSKRIPLYKSFGYAFEGIFEGVKQERNMKIHLLMSFVVICCGFLFHISLIEWTICLLLIGLIIALELVNTAIEATVDLITIEKHPLAKIAKDTAAGAVLIMSIIAFIIGLIIFLPKILILL